MNSETSEGLMQDIAIGISGSKCCNASNLPLIFPFISCVCVGGVHGIRGSKNRDRRHAICACWGGSLVSTYRNSTLFSSWQTRFKKKIPPRLVFTPAADT